MQAVSSENQTQLQTSLFAGQDSIEVRVDMYKTQAREIENVWNHVRQLYTIVQVHVNNLVEWIDKLEK